MQGFSKGGGGHTVSNIIVMAFSPQNIVGCLFKKAYKGRGVRVTEPPRYALEMIVLIFRSYYFLKGNIHASA